MAWLPQSEKISKICFFRFDVIHERDGQTDGRTDGHCVTAKTALMHRIARLKPINVQNNNDTLSIRIVVKKTSFQGLSEDADGDGWVTKLRGKSIPGQRAR